MSLHKNMYIVHTILDEYKYCWRVSRVSLLTLVCGVLMMHAWLYIIVNKRQVHVG